MSVESVLWEYLRDHVKDPFLDMTRVENSVGPGTPDVNYVCRGQEGWMELKYRLDEPGPKVPLFLRKGLRTDQRTWITERVNRSGTVWIVAGVARDIYFVHGSYAEQFNSLTLDALANASSLVLMRGASFDAQAMIGLLSRGIRHPPRPFGFQSEPRSKT